MIAADVRLFSCLNDAILCLISLGDSSTEVLSPVKPTEDGEKKPSAVKNESEQQLFCFNTSGTVVI